MGLVIAVGIELEGQPQIGNGVSLEGLSHHADDRVRLIAERDGRSYDLRIAAKFALPQPIAQYDNLAAVGSVFPRREGAAQHHRRAEEAKVGLGHVQPMHLFRHCSSKVESWPAKVIRSHILNDAGLLLPVVKFCDRGVGIAALRIGVHELHDPVRVRVRERLEQHRVHDREDRGVRPDAQRQRRNGGEREAWILHEHVQRVFEIVEEIAHWSAPQNVVGPA